MDFFTLNVLIRWRVRLLVYSNVNGKVRLIRYVTKT